MRILLTGAFGNIGQNVLRLLLDVGYDVRCFDVETESNKKVYKTFARVRWQARKMEMVWGDISKPDHIKEAVQDVEAIIHLAAIIPPFRIWPWLLMSTEPVH